MVTSIGLSLNGVDFNLTEFLSLTSNMDNLSSLENIIKLTDSIKNSIESIQYSINKPLRAPFVPFASPSLLPINIHSPLFKLMVSSGIFITCGIGFHLWCLVASFISLLRSYIISLYELYDSENTSLNTNDSDNPDDDSDNSDDSNDSDKTIRPGDFGYRSGPNNSENNYNNNNNNNNNGDGHNNNNNSNGNNGNNDDISHDIRVLLTLLEEVNRVRNNRESSISRWELVSMEFIYLLLRPIAGNYSNQLSEITSIVTLISSSIRTLRNNNYNYFTILLLEFNPSNPLPTSNWDTLAYMLEDLIRELRS